MDLGTEARVQLSAAAAMWEIEMQLAILNEREIAMVGRIREQLAGETPRCFATIQELAAGESQGPRRASQTHTEGNGSFKGTGMANR